MKKVGKSLPKVNPFKNVKNNSFHTVLEINIIHGTNFIEGSILCISSGWAGLNTTILAKNFVQGYKRRGKK